MLEKESVNKCDAEKLYKRHDEIYHKNCDFSRS